MSEYKPNSHKAKAEEHRVQKVVSGSVKTKPNHIRKLRDVFISEDVKDVKSYLIWDIFVPTAKKVILDSIIDTAKMVFGGGVGGGSKASTSPKVSYRNYYDKPAVVASNRAGTRFDYDDIIYETRGDADAALFQMREIIEHYGFVTVADMYDQAQLSQPYTSNKYGWMDLTHADVVRGVDGYVIKLPRAMPIDK